MIERCRSKLVAKRQPPSTVLIKRLSPQVSIIALDQNVTPPPALPSLHVPRGLASREGSKAGLILISNHDCPISGQISLIPRQIISTATYRITSNPAYAIHRCLCNRRAI